MRVALTGSTGFIGSHVLRELLDHGHEVTALVKDGAQSDVVSAQGAQAEVVDLYDRPNVVKVLADSDGAVHTASPGDATSADLDSAVVDAAIEAFDGTGKPYAQISGLWAYGNNDAITEDSPFNAPAMVAFRPAIEARVLGTKGMRGVVPISSVAYGDGGGGIPGLLLGSPRDDEGNLIMVGNGLNSTAAEITEAAAVAAGAAGAVPGSDEEARARVGEYFAEVLLLSQGTQATKARTELGWEPSRPSLVDEFREGSYRS